MHKEDEEIEQLSDLDSGDETGTIYFYFSGKFVSFLPDNSKSEDMNGGVKKRSGDIEDLLVAVALRNGEEELDKQRGFIKYKRQKVIYRPPEQRIKDWDEVN